jgi:hypothetical protein
VLVAGALARPVSAVMDINDRGPLLDVGRFALRITNIGVVGNAFFDKGLSFDPSFEYPRGSGHELLNHADLWVGARKADGTLRVSGGPILEWRPTLDPADTVRVRNAGDPGTRSYADDDGDGRIDEELLNGRDDDGDGRVDEDVLLPAQQMLAADYTDDQPEAVNYTYPTGERPRAVGARRAPGGLRLDDARPRRHRGPAVHDHEQGERGASRRAASASTRTSTCVPGTAPPDTSTISSLACPSRS